MRYEQLHGIVSEGATSIFRGSRNHFAQGGHHRHRFNNSTPVYVYLHLQSTEYLADPDDADLAKGAEQLTVQEDTSDPIDPIDDVTSAPHSAPHSAPPSPPPPENNPLHPIGMTTKTYPASLSLSFFGLLFETVPEFLSCLLCSIFSRTSQQS